MDLPGVLATGFHGWRLDAADHAESWNSGLGAFLVGGRWNSKGTRLVYGSADPSTAILEVAVHKGFRTLDTAPHVLTAYRLHDPASVHVVRPEDVPNPNWLRPGTPGAGQMAFGDDLTRRHAFVLIPSAVSIHSWNMLMNPVLAEGAYTLVRQEAFALDTRLHPPAA